ncbi:MAG: phosphoglycolate phosphatase [Rhizobiaceae bacterium]
MSTLSDRIIVFDLDGTLVDSMRDLIPALNRTIARDGLPPIAFEDVGHIVGKGAMAMISRAFDFHGKPLKQARQKELLGVFLKEYEARIADDTVYFDGVFEALDALETEDWRFAICTNKFEHLARELVTKIGGAERFAAITGGDTFEVKKPNPVHIIKTVELADADPAKAIMVGDSNNDIDAAIAAGWPSIAVAFGYSDRPVEELGASTIISHFDELSDAVRNFM